MEYSDTRLSNKAVEIGLPGTVFPGNRIMDCQINVSRLRTPVKSHFERLYMDQCY